MCACVCLWTRRDRMVKGKERWKYFREIREEKGVYVHLCGYKILYKVPTAVTFDLFWMLLYAGMCISRIWCSGAPEGVKCVCVHDLRHVFMLTGTIKPRGLH